MSAKDSSYYIARLAFEERMASSASCKPARDSHRRMAEGYRRIVETASTESASASF